MDDEPLKDVSIVNTFGISNSLYKEILAVPSLYFYI